MGQFSKENLHSTSLEVTAYTLVMGLPALCLRLKLHTQRPSATCRARRTPRELAGQGDGKKTQQLVSTYCVSGSAMSFCMHDLTQTSQQAYKVGIILPIFLFHCWKWNLVKLCNLYKFIHLSRERAIFSPGLIPKFILLYPLKENDWLDISSVLLCWGHLGHYTLIASGKGNIRIHILHGNRRS